MPTLDVLTQPILGSCIEPAVLLLLLPSIRSSPLPSVPCRTAWRTRSTTSTPNMTNSSAHWQSLGADQSATIASTAGHTQGLSGCMDDECPVVMPKIRGLPPHDA
jgi:hypothetical protein